MNHSETIKAFIPRSLFTIDIEEYYEVNYDGLSPVEISWINGFVSKIKPIHEDDVQLDKILFPRFVEPHAHFDKSFSWVNFPNLKSNYENALSVNLEEHITRTQEKVLIRAEKSLKLAIKNGYRAIRTHIDTYNNQDKEIWPGIFELKNKYQELIKLQFVALAPLEFWSTTRGELLAMKLKEENGVLGGVLVPPFNKKNITGSLTKMLLLADKYNLEIDLHVDESNKEPAAGIKLLLKIINKLNLYIPITCSHSSSSLFLSESELKILGKQMAEKNIKVIALPLTNFWLLNRGDKNTPLERPVAPIKQLQKSFIDVSIGSDNVQDPWYPFGNFDPFYLMSYALPILQLNPWDRLSLSALVTSPSRLLNLNWNGVISIGCPADFVVVKGKSWADIFSGNIKREVLIKGEWNKK